MVGTGSELRAALSDLADFERRVVLMEPDRHRARQIAGLFEEVGWMAEALACYRLAGDGVAVSLLESQCGTIPERREIPSQTPIRLPQEGPFTLLEELTKALVSEGNSAVAETFAATFARSLAGHGLPPESVIQSGAKIEAAHGPVSELRVEIAAALLCLGEDAVAYQVLLQEAARPRATLRAKKLLASVLEARGRLAEAVSLYENIAALQIDYPGVKAALRRLASEDAVQRRYIEEEELHRGAAGTVVSRARDRNLGREVVVKRHTRGANTGRARMDRELEVCERVEHPALVTIVDVDPKSRVMVYESLEGDLLCNAAAQSVARNAWLWSRVCEAVAGMHAVGLVHGRIALDHVLFSRTRGVVLGGLAGAVDALVHAPDDVCALAQCIEESASEGLSVTQRALLAACKSPEPAQRPTASALARAMRRA